jgi:general secretion pathway protein K
VNRERGFALVAALWLLVVIGMVGLDFAARARIHRLSVLNAIDESRARAAAWAGVERTQARLERLLGRSERSGALLSAAGADPWHDVPLEPDSAELDGAGIRVTLADPGAALNLNRAAESELQRLLVALRFDAGLADRLAQAISDWRDPDDLHRPRGAEQDWYLDVGAPYLPRNGPFAQVSELLQVKEMTLALYQRVAPFLTTLGSGRINLNSAGPEVLLTLGGFDETTVGVLLAFRRRGRRLERLFDLGPMLPPGARDRFNKAIPELLARTTLETGEMEIRSEGRSAAGKVRVRVHALFVRAGTRAFLTWKRFE